MKKSGIRGFIMGFIAATLVLTAIVPVTAAMIQKQITVSTGVNIYLDDIKLSPKDANGKLVDVFIYNGTTYLPVRAISEAIGKPVSWDGKTQSVYLGKRSEATVLDTLEKMDYYNKIGEYTIENNVKDIFGNVYPSSLYITALDSNTDSCWREYAINGMYSELSGRLILSYADKGSSSIAYVRIYADDNLIYNSTGVTASNGYIDFDVDLTNVLNLKVEVSQDGRDDFYLVNTKLYQ